MHFMPLLISRNKISVAFTWVCLCASLHVFAQAPGGPPRPTSVKAAPVKLATVTNDISAVGSLLANESVIIRPEIAGRITGIHFAEGQAIAAKAKLVTLEAAEFQAQVAGSSADAMLNKQRMDRAQDLFNQGFISQQALDEARSNRARAAAKQAEDEARLTKTIIRAPFSGVVGLRKVSSGAYVQPGTEIVRLDNIDVMKLDFRVPEVFLAKVAHNQPVSMKVDAFPQGNYTGNIYAIEPAVDEQTRTILVRAKVTNPGGKLRPGMFARVSLQLDAKANAMLIPEQAIIPKGKDSFVYRIVEGKAKLSKVETGKRSGGEVEIISGLAATDVVVTDGQMKLQPDGLVQVGPPAEAPKPAQNVDPAKPIAPVNTAPTKG